MKKAMMIVILLLLSIVFVVAQESHNTEIEQGKQLVESKISCDALSDEQLESIGDYYMEQMHPGEAHELMDNMMGGEGSQSLKQVHINMAKRLYCNDNVYVGYGMMNSGGMMNMMGYLGYGSDYWSLIDALYIILLVGLIILVYFWIIKLWKGKAKKR